MVVYVDPSRHEYTQPKYPFRRMLMCHMVADTLQELHEMADAIGVARRHFQEHASLPHYDICKSKRAEAVRRGAVELTSTKELIKIARKQR